jgi:hypothetical protein
MNPLHLDKGRGHKVCLSGILRLFHARTISAIPNLQLQVNVQLHTARLSGHRRRFSTRWCWHRAAGPGLIRAVRLSLRFNCLLQPDLCFHLLRQRRRRTMPLFLMELR